MKVVIASVTAVFLAACTTIQSKRPPISVLVDLDPSSAEQTVIIESITADKEGRLYVPDRVTGNVLRVDPKSPKPVVVGRIETREIKGKKARADGSGLAFNQQGDLFIAAGGFSEVVRIKGADLNPSAPGRAETFATGTPGANGVAFDKQGNLYVSGGRAGKIYRIGPGGGTATAIAQIEPHTRTLADGKTTQPIVENGLLFDSKGILHVADTARGAIWKLIIGPDGSAGKPTLLAQSPMLEGADGIALDRNGNCWVAVNERNAIATVTADGTVREVAKNDSKGPLEFPSAIVFVGGTAYISNFNAPRRDNLDANGKTATDGIGASIVQITP